MRWVNYIGCSRSSEVRLIALFFTVGLAHVSAFSQAAAPPASLRGTAKVNGTLVVEGVMVVLKPYKPKKGDGGRLANGDPVPAWVATNGEYRIDDLTAGKYYLVAVGKSIKDKRQRVTIEPGNINEVDIVLERAQNRTTLHARVLDSTGAPLGTKTVAIYSSELPPSVCDQCILSEAVSNERGEIDYPDLASEQAYTLAIKTPSQAAGSGDVITIATGEIRIGETEALVELRVGGGLQPGLTATLLPALQFSPAARMETEAKIMNEERLYTVAKGKKIMIHGVVIRRDSDTFMLRDSNGRDLVVRLDEETAVKAKGGFLHRDPNYAQTQLLRGLNIRVEGRGNESGELVADKIRFDESDLRIARAVESRASPLEERAATTEAQLSQIERNAQRLSGQLEELHALANAAKGGARAAQDTADAAVAGVNAINERISSLDDFDPQAMIVVNFRAGSAELTPETKLKLNEIATKAVNSKGYVLEVSGYADSTGSISRNRTLSQRRVDAVIRHLVKNQTIPLRRIVTPYGFGESNPIAENTTRDGRAMNRRVEIKLLVNRGVKPSATDVPKTH